MPQLRKDPVSKRWVIISLERAKRPSDFIADPQPIKGGFCPFCGGNEEKTPPEITACREEGSERNAPGWRVRVVPNKFPALQIEGELGKCSQGMYEIMNGIGAHEVIIETPHHETSITALSDDQVREVIWTYRDRLEDLKKDKRFAYAQVFKNVGEVAGASLEHTHSQIIVTPVVPKTVMEEMEGAQDYYRFRARCIFCDMVEQELADGQRLVVEGDHFVAFTPFASRFPFEMWIVPRRHSSHFEDIQEEEAGELAYVLKTALKKLEKSLEHPPYNYILHTTPFDHRGVMHLHWHIEIIPRLTKVAGFEWGSDFYINPVLPETAAEFLREV